MVMDIQRKCFEEKMCHKLVGDFNAMNNRYNELIDQLMWEAWQAAKAQAVPDGFVVVPKQPTPKMIDATWNYDDEIQDMSHNARNAFIYKAMIEAQEPAK